MWALTRPLTGPGMVFAGASLAAIGAWMFSLGGPITGLLKRSAAVLSALLVLAALIQPSVRLFEIKWVKNVVGLPVASRVPSEPLVERWNSHSVVTVFRDLLPYAFGWGMSPTYKAEKEPQQLMLSIDAAAGTVITKYSGRADEIRHLRYDVTSLAHHLRPESDVLIIGTGGGRDVLTSLLYNPKQVTGVEINRDILDLITKDMASFTGNLAQNPKLRFVNDEARSWIERSNEKFDIIQASLIDSWAATSAGAFVLTENSLYTVEAWTEFLSHLTDRGVLTMSRWWVRSRPGEMIRCTTLAYEALRNLGAKDPRQHVLIATTDHGDSAESPTGVGTIIISAKPFSAQDVATFKALCKNMDFTLLLTPDETSMPIFAEVLSPQTHEQAIAGYSLNISPTTDDAPFFFNMLRLRDFLRVDIQDQWMTNFNVRAITILVVLFVLVVLMSIAGLFIPLWLHERAQRAKGIPPLPLKPLGRHGTYFAAIGLGFILVEISLIQRLTLFLGHPVYSLTVVLFSILLATGIGSSLVGRFVLGRASMQKRAGVLLWLLFFGTLALTMLLPHLLQAFHGVQLAPRIALATITLFAIGILMGCAFPIGLTAADREVSRATPWLWAINGALSVIGSVFAMILSIGVGIMITGVVGAGCYLIAVLVFRFNRQALTD